MSLLRRSLLAILLLPLFFSPMSPVGASPVREGSLDFKGMTRTFLYVVPEKTGPSPLLPVVLILHGGGGSAEKMVRFTGKRFNELAEQERFLAVYPDAVEHHWNDGRTVHKYRSMRENIDDAGFLCALMDLMVSRYHGDPARIYVTGVSNGGFMTHRLAVEQGCRLAAAAPVIASLPEAWKDERPVCAVPLLMINGTEDGLVPWNGREVKFLWQTLGRKLTVPETVAWWAERNGCGPRPAVEDLPDLDPRDQTRIKRETYEDGKAEVVFYAVTGGGHTWPGAMQYAPKLLIGRVSKDMDACLVIWEFFKRHKR